jgi:glyoxylase-like metal-dependent hydrolase (beta-lactamase superfamily II)
MSTALKWKIFVTPGVPTVNDDVAPGETVRMWSPTSSILLYGERDAILVDTLTTTAQANALADWVEKAGKNLTTIYATHGHGDHFFGNGILLKRFPGAKAVATPKVLEIMKKQTSPQVMAGLWNKRFPGLIPENIVLPDEMKGNSLHLEGHELNVVDVGHTDTDDCTCLHVPSADLVVAGDIAYNDVHQYFAESLTHEKRMEWIAALDKVEALKPKVVIAGHKRETNDDGPHIIEESRQYIRDFDRLVEETSTTLALYNAMLELYPERLNRGALWGSARALKGWPSPQSRGLTASSTSN